MKRGLIRNFRSKRNIELMKYQIGNTIELLTKDNLSLIRENVTVRKNGNVAVFTFGIYLNGAITEEQEALDQLIKLNKKKTLSKKVLYISKKGFAYKLFGYLPNEKKFVMVNISNFNDQITISEEFAKNAFIVDAEVPPERE